MLSVSVLPAVDNNRPLLGTDSLPERPHEPARTMMVINVLHTMLVLIVEKTMIVVSGLP